MTTSSPASPVAAPPLLIRAVSLPRLSRMDVVRRVSKASASFTHHLAPTAARVARHRPVAERDVAAGLRKAFDELGGTFTKLGQLIGSAPSLVGEEVAAEFRGCLDAGAPVPFDQVRQAVEDDLGLPLGLLFRRFEEQPLAAASLAVVHEAELPDGQRVAVKVLRPGIEAAMATDLAVMLPLFRFLGREIAVGVIGELPGLVSGLAEQVAEEVDLRNEARSILWFDHLSSTMGLDRVTVPLPIASHSGRRVLTMEFIDGVPVDDVTRIAELGIDPAPLVQDTVKAWFAVAICTGAFHGDIHAGNLLVTPDNRLAVLDWGIVGRLDLPTQRFFRRVIEGALGDESAWPDVWQHAKAVYGDAFQRQLGLDDQQMVAVARAQIEPLFIRPFGEIRLTDLIISAESAGRHAAAADGSAGPPTGASPGGRGAGTGQGRVARTRQGVSLWRSERRRRREHLASGAIDSSFDRGMFLLSKQLVYFDRYGKLFLPDVPLMWDREAFRMLLGEPATPTQV